MFDLPLTCPARPEEILVGDGLLPQTVFGGISMRLRAGDYSVERMVDDMSHCLTSVHGGYGIIQGEYYKGFEGGQLLGVLTSSPRVLHA